MTSTDLHPMGSCFGMGPFSFEQPATHPGGENHAAEISIMPYK
jgi:hypothetical protein